MGGQRPNRIADHSSAKLGSSIGYESNIQDFPHPWIPIADSQHRRPRRVPGPDPRLVLELELVLVLHQRRLEPFRRLLRPVPIQPPEKLFPSEWHRDNQIVYVKADLLKVAGRMPGGVAI